MKVDRIAYILMFCGLLLVRKNRATLEESLSLVPDVRGSQELLAQLTHPQSQA